jgi:hypothetical protein
MTYYGIKLLVEGKKAYISTMLWLDKEEAYDYGKWNVANKHIDEFEILTFHYTTPHSQD